MTLQLTQSAETIVGLAKLDAARRHNGIVDTEHLLFTLLTAPNPSHRLIEEFNLNSLAFRLELTGRFTRMVSRVPGEVEETPAFKKVLEIAQNEAWTIRSREVGTDHILLGLAIEPTGYAGHYLSRVCGVDYVKIRTVLYGRQAGRRVA